MGADAELVVLSMGLALWDIHAAHFNEELPEDAPDWLKVSSLDINSAHRLSEIWGEQLPSPSQACLKGQRQRQHKGSGVYALTLNYFKLSRCCQVLCQTQEHLRISHCLRLIKNFTGGGFQSRTY
jgi:hypothetical protein